MLWLYQPTTVAPLISKSRCVNVGVTRGQGRASPVLASPSKEKGVNASLAADIEAVLRRDQRLEASEAVQGLAGKDRFAGIAAERVKPIIAFGAKHPNDRIGMPVCRGRNRGAPAAERTAPGGGNRRRRACCDLQDRQIVTSAGLRAMRS